MRVKGIIDEDFVNYKKPSLFIAFPNCTFKCDILNNCQVCQNWSLTKQNNIEVPKETIIERFISNPITEAIVFGGLEPFDSMLDVVSFIDCFRNKYHRDDDIVIYTGYTEEEIETGNFDGGAPDTLKDFYKFIQSMPNIIIKFGRYIMNDTPHYDEVLGVNLASHNQYAKEVGCNANKKESESDSI